jgi:hypothetical protein
VAIPRVADGFSKFKTKTVFCVVVISSSLTLLFWIEMDNSGYNNHNILSCEVGIRIQWLLNKVSLEGFAGFYPTKVNHHLLLIEKFQIFQARSIK